MKKLFIILFALLLSNLAYATPHFFVFHINGVSTNELDSYMNFQALEKTANRQTSNMVTFDYIWNPTDTPGQNLLTNLYDVAWQKAEAQHVRLTLDDYVHNYITTTGLPNYPESSPEYKKLKGQIKDIYLAELEKIGGEHFSEIIKKFNDKIVPVPFQNIVNLLKATNSDSKDNYVLLLPHSQGNLYANALVQYLRQNGQYTEKNLINFGIATPSNEIIGGFYKTVQNNYITSSNDFVIGGLRLISSALPSNYNIPFDMSFPLGHKLTDVYLTNTPVKERIASIVQNILNSFVSDIADNLNQHNAKLAVTIKQGDNINFIANNQTLCNNNGCDESKSLYYYASDKSYRWYLFMADQQPLVAYRLYSEIGKDHNATINLANTANVSIFRITCRDNQVTDNWRDCYRSTENRYQTLITSPQSTLNSYDLAIAKQKYPDSFMENMILGREWLY